MNEPGRTKIPTVSSKKYFKFIMFYLSDFDVYNVKL